MAKKWSIIQIRKILNEEPVTEVNSIAIRNILQKRMVEYYETIVRKSGFLLMKRPKADVEKDITLVTIRNRVCPSIVRDFDIITERFIRDARNKEKSYCRIMIVGAKPSESSREYFRKSSIDYIFFNYEKNSWESRFVGYKGVVDERE